MTKEKYKHILHTAKRPEELDGIIRVAMYDDDIKLEDYGELLNERKEIIENEKRDV